MSCPLLNAAVASAGVVATMPRPAIAQMPGERIGLIGHSLGGALALKLAASEARVSKVMTTATLGAPFPMKKPCGACGPFPPTAPRCAMPRNA